MLGLPHLGLRSISQGQWGSRLLWDEQQVSASQALPSQISPVLWEQMGSRRVCTRVPAF
jgi:hypothetical protein